MKESKRERGGLKNTKERTSRASISVFHRLRFEIQSQRENLPKTTHPNTLNTPPNKNPAHTIKVSSSPKENRFRETKTSRTFHKWDIQFIQFIHFTPPGPHNPALHRKKVLYNCKGSETLSWYLSKSRSFRL